MINWIYFNLGTIPISSHSEKFFQLIFLVSNYKCRLILLPLFLFSGAIGHIWTLNILFAPSVRECNPRPEVWAPKKHRADGGLAGGPSHGWGHSQPQRHPQDWLPQQEQRKGSRQVQGGLGITRELSIQYQCCGTPKTFTPPWIYLNK